MALRTSLLGRGLVFGLLVCACGTASADWHDLIHKMHLGYHRNVAWPDPFNEVDAMQVVAPFEIMKQNGWRTHNTIGHELFRPGDGQLSASGHNRVRWIATQAPAGRRDIYVLQGNTPNETGKRLRAVREAVATFDPVGVPPQIYVTQRQPPTTPGATATKINRDWLEQMPAPRLPSTSAAGNAGATSE